MPRRACPDVSSLGEGAAHAPQVPEGVGFAPICPATGEIPSRPHCHVGLGAGSAHWLGLEEIGLWGCGRQFPLFTCSLVTHMTELCRHSPAVTPHSQAPQETCRVWDEEALDSPLQIKSNVLPFCVLKLILSSLPGFPILQLGLNSRPGITKAHVLSTPLQTSPAAGSTASAWLLSRTHGRSIRLPDLGRALPHDA